MGINAILQKHSLSYNEHEDKGHFERVLLKECVNACAQKLQQRRMKTITSFSHEEDDINFKFY